MRSIIGEGAAAVVRCCDATSRARDLRYSRRIFASA